MFNKQYIFVILLSLTLVGACSPRDEVSEDTDFSSFSDDIKTFNKPGQRMPRCEEKDKGEDKFVWNTIRFFPELKHLEENIKSGDLSIIVSKGDFNCVEVSQEKSIEIVYYDPGKKEEEKTGAFFYVEKILLMDTGYLLNNTAKLSEYADGMGMSVGQLVAYLKDRPKKQVTITFVSKTKKKPSSDDTGDGGDGSGNVTGGIVSFLQSPGDDGKTVTELSKCGGEPWDAMRIQKWFKDEHKQILLEKIKDQSMKVFVTAGDKHCLPVGAVGVFNVFEEGADWVVGSDPYKVLSVIVRNKIDFSNDPVLASYVAEDMGMSLEAFADFLANMNNDKVNMTFIKWVSEED